MDTVANRLRYAMTVRGISQSELVRLTDIGKSSISTYLSGAYEPKQRNIYKLAHALRVNEAWLMGHDVPMETTTVQQPDFNIFSIPGVEMLPKVNKVPIVGTIACGQPLLAEQNVEGYAGVPEDIHADFALRCKGDSMIGARIYDGDIVYIRQQPDVEDGEIAAVLIDNEATLKRVYKIGSDRLELRAENPSFATLRYQGEELNTVRIMGKAVYFTSLVR